MNNLIPQMKQSAHVPEITRCGWCVKEPAYIDYHDKEWGVPLHDDKSLFEMIILEGAQAGLSWITILKRRENYRRSFDNFDAEKISKYREDKIQILMKDEGIIRNELKIRSVVSNAKSYLALQKEFGSFDNYIWQFTDYTTIVNNYTELGEVPAKTEESELMSKDLLKKGFKFVGSTICYAFMQATGMVDDHIESCWKRKPSGHLLLDL